MKIALRHMHHFSCAGNIPSLHCTTIAILHLMGASLSWFRAFALGVGRFCHYPL